MWNKMEATHQLLTAGYNVLYADTDINFLKNPLSDLEKICEEGNYDVAFQIAGGASICPGFFYAKSNAKTIHLFNSKIISSYETNSKAFMIYAFNMRTNPKIRTTII